MRRMKRISSSILFSARNLLSFLFLAVGDPHEAVEIFFVEDLHQPAQGSQRHVVAVLHAAERRARDVVFHLERVLGNALFLQQFEKRFEVQLYFIGIVLSFILR